jgi:hypothetical protein
MTPKVRLARLLLFWKLLDDDMATESLHMLCTWLSFTIRREEEAIGS